MDMIRIMSCNAKITSLFFGLLRRRHYSTTTVRLKDAEMSDHYNLIVIGGGSGGLACAKEAATLGKRVAVLDYVSPSPRGTTWKLGGTCVNVGCIPKKLMHQASLLGDALKDAKSFGFKVPDKVQFSWETLSDNVQKHIKSLNFGHRTQLRLKHVDFWPCKGTLRDRNTVLMTDEHGQQKVLTTDYIVIATGTRPKYPPDVRGAKEYAISSDDIFWMKRCPGKTLCIGASYVALEIAGFLTGIGYDTTVMVRSVPLSRFDQQMAELIVREMAAKGTKFIRGGMPLSMEKVGHSESVKVTWTLHSDERFSEVFDTVLVAIGRTATTSDMGLAEVGVKMNSDGFVIGGFGNEVERSSVPNIFAIGDVLERCLQLTPVAIKSGKMLAHRLFGKSHEHMDYELIPTTVFTPLEYSFVGLTQAQAEELLGESNVCVYHAFFKPLEYTLSSKSAQNCYIKVIVKKTSQCEVLGIHYAGPNAGEVLQGFAVAMRCGLTKDRLLSTVAIHPTCAEEIVKLSITKESGLDPMVTGC